MNNTWKKRSTMSSSLIVCNWSLSCKPRIAEKSDAAQIHFAEYPGIFALSLYEYLPNDAHVRPPQKITLNELNHNIDRWTGHQIFLKVTYDYKSSFWTGRLVHIALLMHLPWPTCSDFGESRAVQNPNVPKKSKSFALHVDFAVQTGPFCSVLRLCYAKFECGTPFFPLGMIWQNNNMILTITIR